MTTIDAPESGRTNKGQGSTTSTGREDYIDQSRSAYAISAACNLVQVIYGTHGRLCTVLQARGKVKEVPLSDDTYGVPILQT